MEYTAIGSYTDTNKYTHQFKVWVRDNKIEKLVVDDVDVTSDEAQIELFREILYISYK